MRRPPAHLVWYCAVLGQAFGPHAESLGLASVLHDVGKLAIADRILLKPGPLAADERLAIQTHAQVGYEMLQGSGSSLLDAAAVIARTCPTRRMGSIRSGDAWLGAIGRDDRRRRRVAVVRGGA